MKENKKVLNINLSRIIIGMTDIGNLEIEDFELNLSIARNIIKLDIAEKAYLKTRKNLMKKHMKNNEFGVVLIENGNPVFKSEDDRLKFIDAIDKLEQTEFKDEFSMIKTSSLKNIKGIKASMIANCHELIDDDN